MQELKHRLWCPKAKKMAELQLEFLGRQTLFWRWKVVGCDEDCPRRNHDGCMIGKVIEGVV